MKLLISLSVLLLSIILVQMGIGSLRPFNTISGQLLGFTPIEIGIIAIIMFLLILPLALTQSREPARPER